MTDNNYCEWKINDIGFYQGCTSLCSDPEDWWNYCPICGKKIAIVYETKPMKINGIETEPSKYLDNSGFKSKYYFAIITDNFYISGKLCNSENEAVVSWNSLVDKINKEN